MASGEFAGGVAVVAPLLGPLLPPAPPKEGLLAPSSGAPEDGGVPAPSAGTAPPLPESAEDDDDEAAL